MTSFLSVLGNDEIKLMGTYEIGQFIVSGRISNNGIYTAVGTEKGVFLFEKANLLWKDETIGNVYKLTFTPDNKYLIASTNRDLSPTYAYTTLKGQSIPKTNTDFSNYKAQKIEDKVYYDLFDEQGPFDFFSKLYGPVSSNQWEQSSSDPLIIKDSKLGIRHLNTGKLYDFFEIKGENGMTPEAVARMSYPFYYRYNAKIYILSLVKELITREEKIKYEGIISKYFLIATDKGVYLFDINGDKKWFKDIRGIESGFTREYSPHIIVKKTYDILILDQSGNIKLQYNFPEKIKLYGIGGDYISVVSENGTSYFFDIKEISTPSNTNNIVTQEAAQTTKEEIEQSPQPSQETKNTPGFELASVLGGSALVAYIINKRRK